MNPQKKILAINLPAFHRVPENDEWWGEGFTEWDNVKGGKPMYSGHNQPFVPLEGYYDLSRPEDIRRQTELATEYGVYGFIYYHYWFDTHRQIFEKPVEMLKDMDIDFHYCLCWANETWITTWHGLEPKTLLEQKYGNEEEWQAHFDYLLPFFLDKKYIKRDNKPLLFVYKPNEIPRYDDMVAFFNERAKDAGLAGVYFVEYISSKNRGLHSAASNAVMEFEPLYTTFFDISLAGKAKRFLCKKLKRLDFQNYDKLWKYALRRKRTYAGKPIIRGALAGWDNSARKGRNSMIVKGGSAEKFGRYLRELLKTNRPDADAEFIAINAWNEWSEGAYLEPDTLSEYKYLEEVKKTIEM